MDTAEIEGYLILGCALVYAICLIIKYKDGGQGI